MRTSIPTSGLVDGVYRTLGRYLSTINARAIVHTALSTTQRTEQELERTGLDQSVLDVIKRGLSLYCSDHQKSQACLRELEALSAKRAVPSAEASPFQRPISISITSEESIVEARTASRKLAEHLGFSRTDQIKVATSVSEVARNIFSYAGKGVVRIAALKAPSPGIQISAEDEGPGIPNLEDVLSGNYVSATGMGLGIRGCRQLMDEFSIQCPPGGGTRVRMAKHLVH